MTVSNSISNDVRSTLDGWAAHHTPSEALRKAIVKRTLLIAAFDDRFADATPCGADLSQILNQVAKEMLEEPPVPLIGDGGQAKNPNS